MKLYKDISESEIQKHIKGMDYYGYAKMEDYLISEVKSRYDFFKFNYFCQ